MPTTKGPVKKGGVPKGGGGGGGGSGFGAGYDPCNNPRDPLDVAGRINDLINCNQIRLEAFLRERLPLVVIAVLLFLVMVFALYEMIKEVK